MAMNWIWYVAPLGALAALAMATVFFRSMKAADAGNARMQEIASYVRAHAKEGDLVITMGAGDIYKVGELLLAEAEAEA